MSSWSKTLHGKELSLERAFRPMQNAMVRLGYELTNVVEGKRIKFKRRTESAMAWDNHKRAHNATLVFKEKSRGIFSKELYLEVEITFDDWDMTVSSSAAKAWQDIADKLQVMMSDPAVFLPVAPPTPIAPPEQLVPPTSNKPRLKAQAASVVRFECPGCTAQLSVPADADDAECPDCGAEIELKP